MNPFMRAHGNLPGPTQRPVVAGVMAGAVALAPLLVFAWCSGALTAVGSAMNVNPIVVACVFAAVAALGGGLYGRIFLRAANDHRGGWLFGLGYGFLLWMAGAGAVAYLLRQAPVATGRAAQALFISHLLYGFVLGLIFPFVHALIQRKSPWWKESA